MSYPMKIKPFITIMVMIIIIIIFDRKLSVLLSSYNFEIDVVSIIIVK